MCIIYYLQKCWHRVCCAATMCLVALLSLRKHHFSTLGRAFRCTQHCSSAVSLCVFSFLRTCVCIYVFVPEGAHPHLFTSLTECAPPSTPLESKNPIWIWIPLQHKRFHASIGGDHILFPRGNPEKQRQCKSYNLQVIKLAGSYKKRVLLFT